MRDLIFACLLGSGESENETLRLARSIRMFGGEFCFNPIWMLSLRDENELAETTRQELFTLGARLITFELDADKRVFPFAAYVTASGIAEGLAQGETSDLAMMATDTLVLQSPTELLLAAGKSLGACPVHLKLLGSGIDEPVDEMWSLIYRGCQVNLEHIYALTTIADRQIVRAYFNAGLLVVRPERGLLRAWQANFDRLYALPEYTDIYQRDNLYKIYMHQMVLAGCVLSLLKAEEFQQLPFEVNYPLHLHLQMLADQRLSSFSQLVTCRYEDYGEFFGNPMLDEMIHIDKPLKAWLEDQLFIQ